MKIDLTEIYKGLKAWRHERGITAESQKAGYIINIMEEFGELSQALRDYEKIKNGERALRAGIFDIKSTLGEMTIFEGATKGEIEITLEKVEHEIIDALCDISVFTINAGADIPCYNKPTRLELEPCLSLDNLLKEIADHQRCFNGITLCYVLGVCASLCYQYGFDFQKAMEETIKEISSRTGAYDENAKKWVKDESDEAKSKWYKADYNKARITK